MRTNPMHKLLLLAAVAGLLQGAPALAQTSPFAWSAGYSSYKLRPASGTNERMNGWALGGEYRRDPVWSLEASLSRQTGTEADTVDLRQIGFLAGFKANWGFSGPCQPFTHFLVGVEQLHASDGSATDQRESLAFGPGLGLDLAITRNLSARGQVDLLLTRYAGEIQGSPALFVGLVYRR